MTSLIADIGATHARFSTWPADGAKPSVERPLVLATADHSNANELVREAVTALDPDSLSGGCFAIAGPVVEGSGQITNGGLAFDEAELAALLGCRIRLVNDFYALAVAVPALGHLERLGGDPMRGAGSVKAVVGPGSGLGMSILLPEPGGRWRVLPSEGGHADLAPANALEQEVLAILQAHHGAVCWETVLSGPGLVNLYRAVAGVWGVVPDEVTPQQVSKRGVEAEDPVCHQTLEMFFGFLGAVAGNLALTVCARDGVYIGGGIVPALREFALSSPLRRRFDERAELEDFMVDIPLYLILDNYPGLLGAGLCLSQVE